MTKIRIDIVADLMCPWCILNYKRLELTLQALSLTHGTEIHWHPLELNPNAPLCGSPLSKYQKQLDPTINAPLTLQSTLKQLGEEVGFKFNFHENMCLYNTRKAHQLIMWSETQNKQSELEIALFQAYFGQSIDISDDEQLLSIADQVGLDEDAARSVLKDPSWEKAVLDTEQQWIAAGITVVPTIIINHSTVLHGAQRSEVMKEAIRQASFSLH
ncbi:DsbA family oxidoreductase [Vibrio profundum]|uniref:DsbA family oxidoreductase n=1 Tax=Vibrio profundum TaxID=2910247 RepID=UPI003D0D43B0